MKVFTIPSKGARAAIAALALAFSTLPSAAVDPPLPNAFILDGNPTGFTVHSGSATFSNGVYSAYSPGNGAWVQGPVTFKYKWQKGTAQPEDAPLSAIVLIETSAMAQDYTAHGTVNNGWESKSLVGQMGGISASEYVVKTPDQDGKITITVNPSASASATAGVSATATVKMTVIPVRAAVSGAIWYGSPLKPHILMGQKAVGSFSASPVSLTSPKWTVPGTIFKEFNPDIVPTPRYLDVPAADLETASPYWYWKGDASAVSAVKAEGKASFPNNKYEEKESDVSDDFQVEVVKPAVTVSALAFSYSQPQASYSSGTAAIYTSIGAAGGSVTIPSQFTFGGTYAFVQVIASTSRAYGAGSDSFSNKCDGTFPYAFNQQLYSLGSSANFGDTPHVSTTLLPLSADDSFQVTIIFKPGSTDANWVPLKVATWSWSASVSSLNPLTYTKNQSKSAWTDTTDHPTWNGTHSLS